MSWATVPLKRVALIRVSNVDKRSVDGELAVRLCNYTDVYHGDTIRPDQDFMVATASREQVATFRLQAQDVIITKDSETADDIGVPAYVNAGAPDLICGYHLALVRPNAGAIDGRFLFWAMASAFVRDQLASSATGVTRFGIRTDGIGGVLLRMASIQCQRAIATFLDTETARIDALIANKRRQAEVYGERFREAVRLAATGGHSFRDPLAIDREGLRHGWRPVRLGRDLVFGSGTTPLAGDARYYGDGNSWIVTGNLRDAEVVNVAGAVTPQALAEHSALCVHPPGSLVVAMYGATVGRLGITTGPAAVNQACCVMHSGRNLDTRFLFLYLLVHRELLLERTVGAGQPNISQEILRSLQVAAPTVEEQIRLADRLFALREAYGSVVVALTRQISLLQERRQALITAAVAGELDIPGVA